MLQITRVHVKNFRSLKNCSFELKDLQLLIGPNNSGKTNLLRVFEFLRLLHHPSQLETLDLDKIRFKHLTTSKDRTTNLPAPVEITLEIEDQAKKSIYYYYKIELFHVNDIRNFRRNHDAIYNEFWGHTDHKLSQDYFENFDLQDTKKIFEHTFMGLIARNATLNFKDESNAIKNIAKIVSQQSSNTYCLHLKSSEIVYFETHMGLGSILTMFVQNDSTLQDRQDLNKLFKQFIIYKPDTSYIKLPVIEFSKEEFIEGNGDNIVAYLENLLSSDPERFKKINDELEKCIPDFKGYNFDTIESYENNRRLNARVLRLKDQYGVNHLAEDISEGTLYFLMLFAIITQKNIPPILMLEEPETGIHPRRISEIINYIFKLREQYPHLSIIITTHHPYVVDHFSEMTDRVWVFDSENGETQMKNLERDVINPTNAKMKAKKIEPIDYTSSLGEHWSLGFLGGVPNPVN